MNFCKYNKIELNWIVKLNKKKAGISAIEIAVSISCNKLLFQLTELEITKKDVKIFSNASLQNAMNCCVKVLMWNKILDFITHSMQFIILIIHFV